MHCNNIPAGFSISTDRAKLNMELIHDILSKRSPWARDSSLVTIGKSIHNSLCFGVYDRSYRQVGFARVVTDLAIYAHIQDLFILEPYQGQGLGKSLMSAIVEHPVLNSVKKWVLSATAAHEFYEQFGFIAVSKPELLMERIA